MAPATTFMPPPCTTALTAGAVPGTYTAAPMPAPLPVRAPIQFIHDMPNMGTQGGGLWSRVIGFLTGRNRTLVPTIFGISHSDEPDEERFVLRTINDFRKRGARSIGVEASPKFLEGRLGTDNVFRKAALYAGQHGMNALPLESDETGHMRRMYGAGLDYINHEGKFDRGLIQRKAVRCEIEAQTFQGRYTPPELKSAAKIIRMDAEQLRELQEILDSIGDDMDRYFLEEQRWNLRVFETEVKQRLRSERPPLVFIGGGHLYGLSDLEGYRFVDATYLGAPNIPDYERHPNLRRFFYDSDERLTMSEAVEVQTVLFRTVCKYAGAEHSLSRLTDILEAAIEIEPDFVFLAVRADRSFYTYPEGMHFLKISVAEAERRIETAIRQAANS